LRKAGLSGAIRRELRELPGEDLATLSLRELAGWISIYEEEPG